MVRIIKTSYHGRILDSTARVEENGGAFIATWDRRVTSPQRPLPSFLETTMIQKSRLYQSSVNSPLAFLLRRHSFEPNEANAIDYRKGEGHWLQGHVDDQKQSKEPICNLSLSGDAIMSFRNQAPCRNLCVPEKRSLLKRRCLQVMTGKARYDYSHEIAHEDLLSERRVSVTMRQSPLTAASVCGLPSVGGTSSNRSQSMREMLCIGRK